MRQGGRQEMQGGWSKADAGEENDARDDTGAESDAKAAAASLSLVVDGPLTIGTDDAVLERRRPRVDVARRIVGFLRSASTSYLVNQQDAHRLVTHLYVGAKLIGASTKPGKTSSGPLMRLRSSSNWSIVA